MLSNCAKVLKRGVSSKRFYSKASGQTAKPRLVIFGPPGAGKGTQCAKLNSQYGLTTISTGDLLRRSIVDQTAVGKRVKSILEAGQLVDDATVLGLVNEAISSSPKFHTDGFVLDGYPRNLNQADQLQSLLDQKGLGLNAAFRLDVSDSVLIDRICNRWVHIPSGRVYHTTFSPPKKSGVDDVTGEALTQREDDTEARVKDRLRVYHSYTSPLLEYYQKKSLLVNIKAETSPEGWVIIQKVMQDRYGLVDPALRK